MKKKIIIICGGIILVITAGLLIFIKYQSYLAMQEVKKESEAKTVSTSTSVSTIASSTISQHPTLAEMDAVKIDKSDWQIYENKQYGFKISAPKGWTTTLTSSDKSLENGGSLQIYATTTNGQFDSSVVLSVEKDNENLSLKDWYFNGVLEGKGDENNIFQITIPTSDEAVAIRTDDVNSPAEYFYFIRKGNLIYGFYSMWIDSDPLDGGAIHQAIVKSIRFTK
jgi:hypothetical protein